MPLDLSFEDLLFEPSTSCSSSCSSTSSSPINMRRSSRELQQFDSFSPSSYREPSHMERRQTRKTKESAPRPQSHVIQLTCGATGNYVCCPGAAHRHQSEEDASFYVDPSTGVGKCYDPDCTWGFINGEFIVTDLKGFAYSSGGEPVMFLDGRTFKHIRLLPRRA